MITCKEDLIGTYVSAGDDKLVRLYIEVCVSFGLKLSPAFKDGRLLFNDFLYVAAGIEGEFVLGVSQHYEVMKKKLAKSDLKIAPIKPKPTKFVKVEESIFDLKEEFEKGELYFRWLGNGEQGSGGVGYDQIDDINMLLVRWEEKRVYRQVEIDWRDEVKKLDGSAVFHDDGDLFLILDSDCNSFISMCHKVAELTGKPE